MVILQEETKGLLLEALDALVEINELSEYSIEIDLHAVCFTVLFFNKPIEEDGEHTMAYSFRVFHRLDGEQEANEKIKKCLNFLIDKKEQFNKGFVYDFESYLGSERW